jgi:glutaredoxin
MDDGLSGGDRRVFKYIGGPFASLPDALVDPITNGVVEEVTTPQRAPMADTLIVYMIPGCHTSDRAIRELAEDGIAFEARDVSQNEAYWYELEELSGVTPTLVWPGGRVEVGWKGEVG